MLYFKVEKLLFLKFSGFVYQKEHLLLDLSGLKKRIVIVSEFFDSIENNILDNL